MKLLSAVEYERYIQQPLLHATIRPQKKTFIKTFRKSVLFCENVSVADQKANKASNSQFLCYVYQPGRTDFIQNTRTVGQTTYKTIQRTDAEDDVFHINWQQVLFNHQSYPLHIFQSLYSYDSSNKHVCFRHYAFHCLSCIGSTINNRE